MQVDVPQWVTQWLSAAEWRRRQRERDRRLPGLTLYAYGRDPPNPVQPIFRFGSFPEVREGGRLGAGGVRQGAGATVPGGWVPLGDPLEPFLAHHPKDLLHLPINLQDTRQRVNLEWLPPPTPRAASPAKTRGDGILGPSASGHAALRAWIFCSALVVLVLVLMRAIDKCLPVNLLKSRRRRSREWPTPHVRATSGQETDISTVMIPDSDGNELRPADYSDALSVDLPPPYSECTAAPTDHATTSQKLPGYEDPPPAYSDTYVEFSNKNGVPSVLIYSRRRTPLVNRRDIIGSDAAVDDEATTELNAFDNNKTNNGNVQMEITNESDKATHSECVSNASRNESMNIDNTPTPTHTDVNVENNTTNIDTVGSNSTRVDIDVDANNAKDGEVIV